jgi:hypothetical protein
MADIDLKTETPDTTLPTTGFLFGADSQVAASPSVFTVQSVATTLLGSTTLTGATVTTSSPVIDAAQTWNAGGVTFTGLKFNVTLTAAAAASKYLDIQVNSSPHFEIRRGSVNGNSAILEANAWMVINSAAGNIQIQNAGNGVANFLGAGLGVASTLQLGFTGASQTTIDLILSRRAAANLRFGAADAAAPVAQTLSVQSGTAGASALTVSISGTALTIAGAITGTIAIGHAVTGTGVSAGTLITAGSGTSWTVNNSQTVGPITAYFNSVGQNLTITGSQGSGPSAGGSIIFQVAPAGAAATTAQNALATALTINADRTLSPGGSANVFIRGSSNFLEFANTVNNSFLFYGTSANFASSDDAVSINPAASHFVVRSGGGFAWSPFATYSNTTPDLILARDAANTLAQRNGTNAQESRVYGSYTSATNFQRMSIKTLRESSGALSGATYVTTIAIPAYANLIGVTTRVTTAVTGATTYDVGDGTDVDLWGAAIGVALGSQSRTADFTAVAAVGAAATSRTVTLTANGSNFTGGVVEICLHYLTTEAD